MDDVQAIRALIAHQFSSLSWTPNKPANWDGFVADFLPNAPLYSAARPVKPQTLEQFVARMKRLSETELHSLEETVLGVEISVFGNIAVAVVGCSMKENRQVGSQTVEMLLLVKDHGEWRISAQAWEKVTDSNPMPAHLALQISR